MDNGLVQFGMALVYFFLFAANCFKHWEKPKKLLLKKDEKNKIKLKSNDSKLPFFPCLVDQ